MNPDDKQIEEQKARVRTMLGDDRVMVALEQLESIIQLAMKLHEENTPRTRHNFAQLLSTLAITTGIVSGVGGNGNPDATGVLISELIRTLASSAAKTTVTIQACGAEESASLAIAKMMKGGGA